MGCNCFTWLLVAHRGHCAPHICSVHDLDGLFTDNTFKDFGSCYECIHMAMRTHARAYASMLYVSAGLVDSDWFTYLQVLRARAMAQVSHKRTTPRTVFSIDPTKHPWEQEKKCHNRWHPDIPHVRTSVPHVPWPLCGYAPGCGCDCVW